MEARMPGGCVSEGKAPCSLGSGVADVPHSPGLVESCPPTRSPAGSPGLEGWESRRQILSDPLLQAGCLGTTQ